MKSKLALSLLFLLSGAALATDNAADRVKLSGSWRLEVGASQDAGVVWTINNKEEAIHLIHSENDQKVADFECNTMGRECEIKDAKRQMKVSFWFSGPKLVQLEMRGSQVIKRQFVVVGDDTMDVEVIPVIPAGKPEVLHFKRAHLTAVR